MDVTSILSILVNRSSSHMIKSRKISRNKKYVFLCGTSWPFHYVRPFLRVSRSDFYFTLPKGLAHFKFMRTTAMIIHLREIESIVCHFISRKTVCLASSKSSNGINKNIVSEWKRPTKKKQINQNPNESVEFVRVYFYAKGQSRIIYFCTPNQSANFTSMAHRQNKIVFHSHFIQCSKSTNIFFRLFFRRTNYYHKFVSKWLHEMFSIFLKLVSNRSPSLLTALKKQKFTSKCVKIHLIALGPFYNFKSDRQTSSHRNCFTLFIYESNEKIPFPSHIRK